MRWWAPSALLMAVVFTAQAQTPPPEATKPPGPAARPKPAPAPDPAYETAKSSFEALPEAVRKAIQDALVWTGDYNAVTAGTFGRRTYEGIAAWQTRSGAAPTGILSAPQRAALDKAGEAARNAARFEVQADPASGIVVGVPEKLLSKKSPQPGGTRWQSADGRVTLDTKSFKPGEADLGALFDRLTAPGGERDISYKLKKPDFIVVTGETAKGRFYIRYAAGPAGIRGFTVGYDKALADTDRLVIAIANSFLPFPESATPAAVAATPPLPAAPIASPQRSAASGLAVAPGRVLTTAAALQTCPNPTIGGALARVAKRDGSGTLVLLEAEPRPGQRPSVPSPRSDLPKAEEPLVVLQAEPGGRAIVAPATAGVQGLHAPLQPGAGGAPVLDRSGRLVGLVARFPEAPRLIAGVMPPTSYALVPASAVTALLTEAGIAPDVAKAGSSGSLGGAAATLVQSIVSIDCGR